MRKIAIFTAVSFLLASCALPEFLVAPTPTITSTPRPVLVLPSPMDTPTITATQPTPTFTSTPTFIGFDPTTALSLTPPTITLTFTPLPIFADTATPVLLLTPLTSPGEGFSSFTISGNQIFWGVCSPGSVNLEAQVSDPDAVWRVYLFIHLKSTKTDDTTPWYGTTMSSHRNGIFRYTLRADQVEGRRNYLKAWVVLQMVAVDVQQKEIGRSKIYDQALTIAPCP